MPSRLNKKTAEPAFFTVQRPLLSFDCPINIIPVLNYIALKNRIEHLRNHEKKSNLPKAPHLTPAAPPCQRIRPKHHPSLPIRPNQPFCIASIKLKKRRRVLDPLFNLLTWRSSITCSLSHAEA